MPDGTTTAPPPVNAPATDGDSFVADVLSSAGGRADLNRAMRKLAARTERAADLSAAPATHAAAAGLARDRAAGRLADGNPHDAKGRTSKARYKAGDRLKIRSNIGGLVKDGGMEGCRVEVHSNGYVDPERGVMATVTTESEEIVSVPESALEADVRPGRSSLQVSGSSLPRGWHERVFGKRARKPLGLEYCDTRNGCDGHGARHNLTHHQNVGDPAAARSPQPAPAVEPALAAGEADTV